MSGGGRKPAVSGGDEAEVEALLRAAQDAVLLKMQANSHLVSSSSSSYAADGPNLPPSLDPAAAAAAADPLDADLARRFDALRSRPPAPKPKQPDAPSAAAAAAGAGGMDELEARFAALKGAAGPEKETRVRLEDLGGESDDDEDDEVVKVMRWAMDAARLDVATAGAGKAKSAAKEEDDEKSSSDEEEEEEEEEERERKRKGKEMMSKNKSKTKWFSLF